MLIQEMLLGGPDSYHQLSEGMSYETQMRKAKLGLRNTEKQILALYTENITGSQTCTK